MATVVERVSIVETKVEALGEKLDDLKTDVKDVHDCLDRTREGINSQLEKMYEASCEQHAQLAKKISVLEGYKTKGTYLIMGGVGVFGWMVGHLDLVTKLIK
jgi:predicted nuclease with TOPRIM domain